MVDDGKEKAASSAPPVFEQGPIRPPSEARSLLVRVTRNCHWNKCEFCPVYKGQRFSRRSVSEVKEDIRAMAFWYEHAVSESWRLGFGGRLDQGSLPAIYQRNHDNPYMHSILIWLSGGGTSAFLQDADSILLKPDDLADILRFLRETFPGLRRVTTYSRSSTCSKRGAEDLAKLKQAGMDRVHIGLESGSDRVLEKVNKGATADVHVQGGVNVKQAGLELSEYVMPGLGGKELSEEHARETARVLSRIDPDFIRIRSLGLRRGIIMYESWQQGEFEPLNDEDTAAELKLFIQGLEGISSQVVSDHILNLLPEVEGKLPEDKQRIIEVIDRFLGLPDEERTTYVVGRRFGLFEGLDDLEEPTQRSAARRAMQKLREQGGENIHDTIRDIISRFI